MRASVWDDKADQAHWSWSRWDCRGKLIRQVCILGVGDLPWFRDRPELFVNKFHGTDFEPVAFDCAEELVFNRTIEDATAGGRGDTFNATYYENLPFVRDKASKVVSLEETLKYLGES